MGPSAERSLQDAFRALARRDMTGLEALWRELSGSLHNYAFALTASQEEADDILSDVLLRVARRGRPLRWVRSPKAYLFGAVRNAVRSRRRREGRRAEADTFDAPAPEADVTNGAAVRAAVMGLPPEQREVLVLHVWGGLTFGEIGRTVGAPRNTVASRYRYALGKLRALLGDDADGRGETEAPAGSHDAEHAGRHV